MKGADNKKTQRNEIHLNQCRLLHPANETVDWTQTPMLDEDIPDCLPCKECFHGQRPSGSTPKVKVTDIQNGGQDGCLETRITEHEEVRVTVPIIILLIAYRRSFGTAVCPDLAERFIKTAIPSVEVKGNELYDKYVYVKQYLWDWSTSKRSFHCRRSCRNSSMTEITMAARCLSRWIRPSSHSAWHRSRSNIQPRRSKSSTRQHLLTPSRRILPDLCMFFQYTDFQKLHGTNVVMLYRAVATVAERLAYSPPTKAIRAQSPAGSLQILER
ncbi:hypothetical protein PR048_029182 [Dryococelus australis]|uniref:Uncharacterized protein n=1 Tax=Dryococelus australis TaxID=614101 RepID=A0ABQ9GCM7_9NEOP|nr:hypothetical protein PR048_029182 [Dryococelus australis]